MLKVKEPSIPVEELEKATLSWIATFPDLKHHPENFESLSDGVVLTEIMKKIEPKIFDLSKINPETSDNWALRLANIDYLYDGLESYYTNVLNTAFDRDYIDTFKISNRQNKEDLCNLVGLVIVAAVQSAHKESYINAILGLDDTFQTALMDLIERVLHRCSSEQQSTEADTSHVLDNNMTMRASTMFSVTHMTKLEMQEKRLLAKLEELENETHNLQAKIVEINQDREHIRTMNTELTQECNKKSQEVQRLLAEREVIQEKLNAQDSIDELKNHIKLKDHKVEQLEVFIEELKQKREYEASKFQREMEEQKKKMEKYIKIEETMSTYKQAYDDYGNLTKKVAETDEEMQKLKSKIDELNVVNEGLQSKINTYKEKLEAEQTKNITQDIEMIKRETEIAGLKSEKKRLEATNSGLQTQIKDLNRIIEEKTKQQEEAEKAADNPLEKSEIEMVLEEAEKKERSMIEDKQSLHETYISIVAEGEKEILQQENEILKAKCKEILAENEILRIKSKEFEIDCETFKLKEKEDTATIEKLKDENSGLKDELEQLRRASQTPKATTNQKALEAEIEILRRRLLETESLAKQRPDEEETVKIKSQLGEKSSLVIQLTQQIVDLKASSLENTKASSQRIQKLEEEVESKEDEISQLNEDLESVKGILAEIGNQKEEELKILATAMQELAFRNMELQRKLSSTTAPLSQANRDTGATTQNKIQIK